MEEEKRNEIISSLFGADSGESDDEGDRRRSPADEAVANQDEPDNEEYIGKSGDGVGRPSVRGEAEEQAATLGEDEEEREQRSEEFANDDAPETSGGAPAPAADPADLFRDSDDEDLRRSQREDNDDEHGNEEAEADGGFNREEEEMEEYERQKKQRPIGPPLHLKIPLLSPIAPADKMIVVTASNIVGFEMRPFDPDTFDESEDLNVVRWRRVHRANGSVEMESNARMVRWSDGSVQLLLGSELLAADRQSMRQDRSHLFVRHPKVGALQGQGRLIEKMRFRPVDLKSRIHKKLTLGLDSKYKKTTKVKNFITVVDPEKEKEEREKAAEARIRSQEELARKQERVMKKYDRPAKTSPYEAPRRRAGYLEEEEEGDEYDRRWGGRRYMDEEQEAEAERRILHAKRGEPAHRKPKPPSKPPQKRRSEMDDFIADEDEDEDEEAAEDDEEEEEELEYEVDRAKKSKRKGRDSEEEPPEDDEEEEDRVEEKKYDNRRKGRGKMEKRKAEWEDEEEPEDVAAEEDDVGREGGSDSEREKERGREAETKKAPVTTKKRRVVVDSDSE